MTAPAAAPGRPPEPFGRSARAAPGRPSCPRRPAPRAAPGEESPQGLDEPPVGG